MSRRRNSENKIEIPKGFVKKKVGINKMEFGKFNGRKYKVLKNGYGMWSDTGKVFLLNELSDVKNANSSYSV